MDFVQERAAYLAGYGHVAALLDALRGATLVVPLDVNEQFFTLVLEHAPWFVAFTSRERARQFALAAGRDLASVGVVEMTAADLIDTVVTQGPVPTGLVVDPHQPDTMAFPPDMFSPNRFRST